MTRLVPIPLFFLRALLAAALCAGLGSGCVGPSPRSSARLPAAEELRDRFLRLGDNVDRDEAARLAEAAVAKSSALAKEYRVVGPPWFHNSLVNSGFRRRGLCFHWANDLFADLAQLRLRSLELRFVVARMDTRREHNAIVVTALGQDISEGLVLDAWRRSGRLWWGSAGSDKYPWQLLPRDRVRPDLETLLPP